MIILLILGHLMGNFNFPLDQQVSILFHCLSKSKLLGFFCRFFTRGSDPSVSFCHQKG